MTLYSCCVVVLLKDEVDSENPAVRDDPSVQEQIQAWLKQNHFQNILQKGIQWKDLCKDIVIQCLFCSLNDKAVYAVCLDKSDQLTIDCLKPY